MRKIIISILALCLSASIYAQTKKSCGKYSTISCSSIEGAKRSHFCWKKAKPSLEKLSKYCMTKKMKKRTKKSVSSKTTKS